VKHGTPVPCAPRFYWNERAELSALRTVSGDLRDGRFAGTAERSE